MQFIHIFSLKRCLQQVLDLLEWRMKALESKEASLDLSRFVTKCMSHQPQLAVTSHHRVHESSTLACCHESSPSAESSTLQFLQRVTTFQLWAVIVFWTQLRMYTSKLSDSSWFGKITQSNTTFMKKNS